VTAGRLIALPDGQRDRPARWEQLRRAAVRPEYQVDVYRPEPGDTVFFGPTCVVAGCDARGLQRAQGMRGHLSALFPLGLTRSGSTPQR
jgi:hypothetical protein